MCLPVKYQRTLCGLLFSITLACHSNAYTHALPAYTSAYFVTSGQHHSKARYVTTGRDWHTAIYANGFTFERTTPSQSARLIAHFRGSNKDARVAGINRVSASLNYFIDSNTSDWASGVSAYERVAVHDIYPGIDLLYYQTDGSLEFDFRIQPGADPNIIRMEFSGTDRLHIDDEGKLKTGPAADAITLSLPLIYQISDGSRIPVSGSYRLTDDGTIGFEIASYDHNKVLTIDPVVEFSSFLGGTADDESYVTTIKNGFLYVAGTTVSPDFPIANAYQSTLGSIRSAYITKFSLAAGTPQLVYATYIGNDVAEVRGLAVDSTGNAYITGSTSSTNFPLKNAVQTSNAGLIDGFIVKLNAAGNDLVYSTYFGGNSIDRGRGLTIDNSNAVYVTGVTASTDFPVVNAWQNGNGGQLDAFALKLQSDGSAYDYVSYLGGSLLEYGSGIAIDNDSNAVISGTTSSTDYPLVNALQTTNAGGFDSFVTLINPGGTVIYSDYLGGSSNELSTDIAVDSNNRYLVYGQTESSDFPVTLPGYHGAGDAFLTSVDLSASQYHFSRYLGGSSSEGAWHIFIDGKDVAHVCGDTGSSDFPVVRGNPASPDSGTDGYVSSISSDDGSILFSSYIGGTLTDRARGISKESARLIVTGTTSSADFPVQQAFQSANAGMDDSFFTVFNLDIDNDTVEDYFDNCMADANPSQTDTDNDDVGDVCDDDDDNDGLPDILEISIGADPLLTDTDGDTISDFDEVAYDGDAGSYIPNHDLNPLSADSDGDTLPDNFDPIPITFNYNDGDLAPLGAPDGIINAADILIMTQIIFRDMSAAEFELAHGDLFPVDAPDGVIGIQDMILQLQLLE